MDIVVWVSVAALWGVIARNLDGLRRTCRTRARLERRIRALDLERLRYRARQLQRDPRSASDEP